MNEPIWVRGYRVVLAVLAIAAIVGKFFQGTDGFADFLSLFTVQGNAFSAAILLGGAALAPGVLASAGWERARGAAVMYAVTTFIVYGLLINGFDNPLTSGRHWTHTVLHQLMPVVMVLDLAIRPLTSRLGWRDVVIWMVYPIVFLAYSLVRGPLVDWYPYDFIDPAEQGGYDGVAVYVLGITVGFAAIATLVVWASNHRRLPAVQRPATPARVPTARA